MISYFNAGKKLINKLNKAHFEGFFIGGFVRDYLLKKNCNDIDITTSATPDEVKKLFKKVYDTGIKFNSVLVIYYGHKFEVTTYRLDLEYLDNRHPVIGIAKNLSDDVVRRDFTINALAMDQNEKIIDLVCGLKDLEKKTIKAINDPLKRFNEDALRMLRAFYFASKLQFDIEPHTLEAIDILAPTIQNISIERIMNELEKMVNTKNLKGFEIMNNSKIVDYLYGLHDGISYMVNNHIIPNDKIEFYSLCFYFNDSGLDKFKFSNDLKNIINNSIYLSHILNSGEINNLILFSHGLKNILYANRLNKNLNKFSFDEEFLIASYNNLPIKKTCDLAFKGENLIKEYHIESLYKLSPMIDDIKYEILENGLKNDYKDIKDYVDNILLEKYDIYEK